MALAQNLRIEGLFDVLQLVGGPLMVPCAYDYKYYDGTDLLDLIEDGFYDDYDAYDNLQIQQFYPVLGG